MTVAADDQTITEEANIHFNYLNLPVRISYRLLDDFRVDIGPEFGYLMSAKAKLASVTNDISKFWDNTFDFGLAVGLGYNINNTLSVEFRYIHGLSSVTSEITLTNDDGTPNSNNSVKAQNRTFQLSTAVRLF